MAALYQLLPTFLLILSFFSTTITGDRTIDPQTVLPEEECNWNSCWHYSSPPDPICPVDTSQCPLDSLNCGVYHSDCYCKLKTGLACAWSCSWWSWMKVEDWFRGLCPEAPVVDFKKAPNCAAQCLNEKSFDYGCLTNNTNCFCIHGSLFDCQKNCGKQDREKLKHWLIDSCDATVAQAEVGVVTGNFTEVAAASVNETSRDLIFTPKKKGKLKWYEDMALALLVFSIVATAGFWAWTCGTKLRRKRA